MASMMTAITAESHPLTDVEVEKELKANVTVKILRVVKGGDSFFTLNAKQTSTMPLAASAHQIAPLS